MKKIGLTAVIIVVLILAGGWLFMRSMGMGGNMPGMGGNDRGRGGGMMNGSVEDMKNKTYPEGEKPLPIPPILKDENPDPNKAEFSLVAQKGSMEFLEGKKTDTFGYNGDYLGPVIRVKKGEDVSVKIKNKLDEATTVHWHGLEVDGKQDGGPHNGIQPGTTWNPKFTIEQPAATLWYHPHLLDKTGEHVYKGMAGLFLIDDGVTEKLDLPKDYGVNDIPLIIQDKQLDEDGQFDYDLSMHDVMMGLQGDTIMVNGAINPYVEVPKDKVRLRLLNGSNARIYEFRLSNGQAFYQIGTDGGLLEKPVEMTKLVLSSAERAELIVDFSQFKEGETVELTDQGTPFMKFVVTDKKSGPSEIPSQLTEIPEADPSTAVRTREFIMQGMGNNVSINGKQMDMNRIDEELNLHDTEIWEISNEEMGMMGGNQGMAHPFHGHGTQFLILDRDGNPPPANEAGWKDTILVRPGEKVRAIATFDHKGLFMYHCHILEHEDAGMMGQFKVE
ncbi:multicopper oxidase [Bacillus sp. FJAT-27231]|uniref:multicopper oxidase family protein n=1 Tax=Bacillus sp. FJAT-27231 TaxID=1679168 RepID=UPI000670DF4F|nr:multicopper oxidase domain-containing protein [Bacillus sp. FJAT-27231]KMY52536.1 multicopper oxidase [Bacillus sp. FJAT-27231]